MTQKGDNLVQVILIDDDPDHLDLIELALIGKSDSIDDFNVVTFLDPAEALTHLPAQGPAIIICDYSMPGSSGLDWLPDFLRQNIGPMILLTGQGDERIAAQAFRAGASDYLVKSVVIENPEILHQSIWQALRRYSLKQRNEELSRQLKIANGELEQQNTALTELTETAHRFVNDVAHEFRTPLTVIKEFASIMADGLGGEITEKQTEFLGHIIASSRDLAHLIDDFLDSSKLKARSLRVDRQRHSVTDILDAVRPMLRCRAASRRIQITEDIDPECLEVFADAEKAGRVLINLTVNAIKFAPQESEITISVRPQSPQLMEFAIVDHGPGMSPEEVAGIFERFQQVGDGSAAGGKGFGLGLNIARELIRLNLGSVWVESEPGEGSTFAFSLPVASREIVLQRYCELVRETQPRAEIAILQATPGSAADPQELRKFLIGCTYPMDVVFGPDPDGSCTLIGITGQSEKWIERIGKESRQRMKILTDQRDMTFNLQLMGVWSSGDSSESILPLVLEHAQELKRCA